MRQTNHWLFDFILAFCLLLPSTKSELLSRRASTVQVATLWSHHQRSLFDIWSSHLSTAVEFAAHSQHGNASSYYRLSIRAQYLPHERGLSGQGFCCDEQWTRAVVKKVQLANELAQRSDLDSVVVFSDVDVLFLNTSLVTLIQSHISSGNGVSFMARKRKNRSSPKSGVNTGFFAFTVSDSTRHFMKEWALRVGRNDQDTVNSWLSHWGLLGLTPPSAAEQPSCQGKNTTCPERGGMPSVGVFPQWLAVTRFDELSSATAVYHVNGRVNSSPEPTGTAGKLSRLKQAFDEQAIWQAKPRPP